MRPRPTSTEPVATAENDPVWPLVNELPEPLNVTVLSEVFVLAVQPLRSLVEPDDAQVQ